MLCVKCMQEGGGMAGQGFTYYICEKCGQTGYWHNTAIPKICPQCSKDYNLCERCGAPIMSKDKRTQ